MAGGYILRPMASENAMRCPRAFFSPTALSGPSACSSCPARRFVSCLSSLIRYGGRDEGGFLYYAPFRLALRSFDMTGEAWDGVIIPSVAFAAS